MDGNQRKDDNVIHKGPARRDVIWLLSQLTFNIIRIALRHRVLLPELEKLLRWQAAIVVLEHREFDTARRKRDKANASRAAVVTGLNRKDITNLKQLESPSIDFDGGTLHHIIRIVTAWSTEEEYLDGGGKPVDLPLMGRRRSLHSLNRRFGQGVSDRAIADWLVENGNAEWLGKPDAQTERKTLRWKSPVVRPLPYSRNGFRVIGQMGSDFLYTLRATIDPKTADIPRIQETYFSDIPVEDVPVVHGLIKEALHKAMDEYRQLLDGYRKDTLGKKIRMGVGSYSFVGAPLIDEFETAIRSDEPSKSTP